MSSQFVSMHYLKLVNLATAIKILEPCVILKKIMLKFLLKKVSLDLNHFNNKLKPVTIEKR